MNLVTSRLALIKNTTNQLPSEVQGHLQLQREFRTQNLCLKTQNKTNEQAKPQPDISGGSCHVLRYNNSERTHIFVLLTVFTETNDTYHYGTVRSKIFPAFEREEEE